MAEEDLKEQAKTLHSAYLQNLALKIKEGKSLGDTDYPPAIQKAPFGSFTHFQEF